MSTKLKARGLGAVVSNRTERGQALDSLQPGADHSLTAGRIWAPVE